MEVLYRLHKQRPDIFSKMEGKFQHCWFTVGRETSNDSIVSQYISTEEFVGEQVCRFHSSFAHQIILMISV